MKRRRFLVVFLLCCTFVATLILYSNIYSPRGGQNAALIVNIGEGVNFQNQLSVLPEHVPGRFRNVSIRFPGVLKDDIHSGGKPQIEIQNTGNGDDSAASVKKFAILDNNSKVILNEDKDDNAEEKGAADEEVSEINEYQRPVTKPTFVNVEDDSRLRMIDELEEIDQQVDNIVLRNHISKTALKSVEHVGDFTSKDEIRPTVKSGIEDDGGKPFTADDYPNSNTPNDRTDQNAEKWEILNILTEQKETSREKTDLHLAESRSSNGIIKKRESIDARGGAVHDSVDKLAADYLDGRRESNEDASAVPKQHDSSHGNTVTHKDNDEMNIGQERTGTIFDRQRALDLSQTLHEEHGTGIENRYIDRASGKVSHEFFEPSNTVKIEEKGIVGLDEYEERMRWKTLLEKLARDEDAVPYDIPVLSREIKDHVDGERIRKEMAEQSVIGEVEQPEPKWWEQVSEEEFKSYVNGLQNEQLRFGEQYPRWFSRADVVRMEMLSTAKVTEVYHMDGHERLRLLIFDDGRTEPISDFDFCSEQCGVQKSVDDWFEIFAFHLDRVLGLHRALPSIARVIKAQAGEGIFAHDDRFTDGKPRPVIWWDPDIKHGGYFMENQNSLDLSWTDYQNELKYRCNSLYEKEHEKYYCRTRIKNIEWGKLSVFDFLLQIHDRLDRNCCGYDTDQGEFCMMNGMHDDCDDVDKQFLVHIMTRQEDRSRLVFIDNAGNRKRTPSHLNYRLLEGIREVPEEPINVLRSGNLRDMLHESLRIDKIFWKAVGEEQGVNILVDIIEKRGEILLKYIDGHSMDIIPDY